MKAATGTTPRDRNWERQIDYLYVFDRMLADAERRALQAPPYQIPAPIRHRAFALARKPETPGLPPAGAGAGSTIY